MCFEYIVKIVKLIVKILQNTNGVVQYDRKCNHQALRVNRIEKGNERNEEMETPYDGRKLNATFSCLLDN